MPFVTYHIIKAEKSETNYDFNKTIPKDIDAVVVLGLGVYEDSPSFKLPPEAFRNTMYGVVLARELGKPLFYSGGGVWGISEADSALIDINRTFDGMPMEIITEDRSLNTEENAKNSKNIFAQLGIENPKIVLITSSWHIKRAVDAFDSYGFEVVARPSDVPIQEAVAEKKFTFLDFLPNIEALSISRAMAKEYLGKLKLILFA